MRLGELRLAHGNLLAQRDYCARKFSFWTVYFPEELTEGLEEGRKGLWADQQPVPQWEWRKT